MEDFEAGERPRIINKPSHGLKHQIPVTKVPITLSTNTAHQLNNHLFVMMITILKTNLGSSRNPPNPAIRQISRIQSLTSQRPMQKQFSGHHRRPFAHPQLISTTIKTFHGSFRILLSKLTTSTRHLKFTHMINNPIM
jgi:hypothetical protein